MKAQIHFKTVAMSIVLTAVNIFSITVFAQAEGGGVGGPGGGDPKQVYNASKNSGSVLQGQINFLAQQKRDAENLKRARTIIEEHGKLVVSALKLFRVLNYPFQFDSRISTELVESTFKKLLDAPNAIIAERKLNLRNSEGKLEQVTFISDPKLFNIRIDVDRYYSFHGISDSDNVSLIATLFHEVLVLNGIEPSMTYTYSKQLVTAFKDISSITEGSRLWLDQSLEKVSRKYDGLVAYISGVELMQYFMLPSEIYSMSWSHLYFPIGLVRELKYISDTMNKRLDNKDFSRD